MPALCSSSRSFLRLQTGSPSGFGLRRRAAFTLLEVVATTMIVVVLGVIVTGGFLMSQKIASANRIRTQARVVLQRNIDLALSIPFSVAGTPPSLELTKDTPLPGVPFNDPGLPTPESGQTGEIPLLIRSDGTPLLSGTLWRHAERLTSPNPANAEIHRVTFTVTYNYLGADQSVSLTTLRARDDQ